MALTGPAQPTLEDLRSAASAAWLWDAARLRIVWANDAGLKLFGCETLFDLVDRPFDGNEPGVASIRAAAAVSRSNSGKLLRLEFPSAATTIDARTYPHALADGRLGLLVVSEAADPAGRHNLAALGLAFEHHPDAMLVIDNDGAAIEANRAAFDLLPGAARWSLAGLLGSDKAAEDFRARLAAAGTLSQLRSVDTRFGLRDIRITARRLEGGDGLCSVILADVTDRRALERQIAMAPAPLQAEPLVTREAPILPEPVLSPVEQAAFVELGKTLGVPKPQPPKEPEPPGALIPEFIRAKLDAAPGANLYVKQSELIHADPRALALLGYADTESMKANASLCTALEAGTGRALMRKGDGTEIEFEYSDEVFPWVGGPGTRYTLRTARVAPTLVLVETTAPPPTEEPAAVDAPPAAAPWQPEIVRSPQPVLPPEPVLAPPPADNHDGDLRALLDTVADGIITIDGKGQIKSFSAGAEAIFGYRTAEVLGKPLFSLLQQDSRKIMRDYLSAIGEPGLGALLNDGREITAVEKNGGEVPLFLTISKMQGKHGADYCAVVRDITQWKKTEGELRAARDEAQQTSRQKSEFLARISHELRTPLNAILGFSEVMRLERFGEIKNDKYRGYVNDIHSSGAHLLSLINDLLDLSKVEAGKLELNFTSVNLSEVVDHAFRLVQEQAASARVLLRKSFPAELPNVVADLRSMRQIMLNLLTNAIKFTDAGGQVIVSAQLNRAGELSVKVKDTGIGMNEEQIRDSLEPFRRVTTDGRDAPGTGLGLPLTKALAEANRTVFGIKSEPRKGTSIELTFPVTRVLAG